MRFVRLAALVAGALVVVGAVTACGDSDAAGGGDAGGAGSKVTLYNAQHEDLVQAMVGGFTKETGIEVDIRSGKDFELANQIVQEGDASPADVFLTENSPAMSLVDSKGGFAKVDAATLDTVPAEFVPSSKNWTGFAARATVLVYNKTALPADKLPASIMDLREAGVAGQVRGAPRQAPTSRPSSARCSSSRARTPPRRGWPGSRRTRRSTRATARS